MSMAVPRSTQEIVVRDLVRRVPTGRGWGNKLPEVRNGQTIANDAWEGPTEVGEVGQYFRCTWRERRVKIVWVG